jgi:transmembrane sensor
MLNINKIMEKQLDKLLSEYITNTIKKDDYDRLMDMIADSAGETNFHFSMKQVWEMQDIDEPFTALQSEVLYKLIITDERFHASTPSILKAVGIPRRSYKKWYSVAAILIVSLSAAWLFYVYYGDLSNSNRLVHQDIAPGGSKAVLTLANGRRIELAVAGNGELVREKGISIIKTDDGRISYRVADQAKDGLSTVIGYNTLRTPVGGEYQIDLPDGTKVWLNALSSITFPSTFGGFKTREVTLEGEAYFEVKHNNSQHFIVKTHKQQVEVLGTHFNINSYLTESGTKTTLIQGSVRIIGRGAKKEEVILKPGEEAMLASTYFVVGKADIETAVAWKNGKFIFKDEEFASIARKIERWYDVEIIYPESIGKIHFEGAISHFRNLSELLRKFESTGDISFKIEGRRITVMR